MAASKCPCGSGRIPTMRCIGIDFCSACVDGTDDRPSLAEVHASPEAVEARESRLRADRASKPKQSASKPVPPSPGSASTPKSPSTGGFVVSLTEHTGPEPAEYEAPEGFVQRPSVNGGTTTMRAPRTTVRPPSPASLSYLRTLLSEREGVTEAEAIRTVLNEARANAELSQSLVSSCIDTLKRIAKPRRHLPTPGVPTDGYEPEKGHVHVIDGTYYRVHKSQQGGFLYGAVWNDEHGKFVGPSYDDRAKGLLRRISKATMATAEQAAAFGQMHKACCFCSRAIDTPESTAVGYGPDCAAKYGLPWG